MCVCVYVYVCNPCEASGSPEVHPKPPLSVRWPLDDIAITNIVWCMAHNRNIGGGGLYCTIGM